MDERTAPPEDSAQRAAREILRDLLGIDVPDIPTLLGMAEATLGAARVERLKALVRVSRLTRRSYEFAGVAALVVATRALGERWWRERSRQRSWRDGDDEVSPDDLLGSADPARQRQWPTTIERLGYWAEAAHADLLWGAPIAEIDLNDQRSADRFPLPPDATVGERFVLAFDAGSRADAVVVRRPDGTLGSELDGEFRHSPPAEVAWGWGIAAGIGPHRLPEEVAGGLDDPYGVGIDEGAAATLAAWAITRGALPEHVAAPWRSAGDAIRALKRRDPSLSDNWFSWEGAIEALADGDALALAGALALLRRSR